eukprot:312001-Chlamydomonas_euryale.AAC.1
MKGAPPMPRTWHHHSAAQCLRAVRGLHCAKCPPACAAAAQCPWQHQCAAQCGACDAMEAGRGFGTPAPPPPARAGLHCHRAALRVKAATASHPRAPACAVIARCCTSQRRRTCARAPACAVIARCCTSQRRHTSARAPACAVIAQCCTSPSTVDTR